MTVRLCKSELHSAYLALNHGVSHVLLGHTKPCPTTKIARCAWRTLTREKVILQHVQTASATLATRALMVHLALRVCQVRTNRRMAMKHARHASLERFLPPQQQRARIAVKRAVTTACRASEMPCVCAKEAIPASLTARKGAKHVMLGSLRLKMAAQAVPRAQRENIRLSLRQMMHLLALLAQATVIRRQQVGLPTCVCATLATRQACMSKMPLLFVYHVSPERTKTSTAQPHVCRVPKASIPMRLPPTAQTLAWTVARIASPRMAAHAVSAARATQGYSTAQWAVKRAPQALSSKSTAVQPAFFVMRERSRIT